MQMKREDLRVTVHGLVCGTLWCVCMYDSVYVYVCACVCMRTHMPGCEYKFSVQNSPSVLNAHRGLAEGKNQVLISVWGPGLGLR